MRFLSGFFRACWTVVLPLLAIFVGATILFFTGHLEASAATSRYGTLLVLLGNVVYVVFLDSRRRWPGVAWHKRLVRLFTFQR